MKKYNFKTILVIIIFSPFIWTFFSSNSTELVDEWEYIFNGNNLDDWTVKIKDYPSGKNFGNTFKVKDG